MQEKVTILIAAAAVMFFVIGGLSLLAHYYTLNGIKSRTVGDGQHGTARFATKKEIQQTYRHILFRPKSWRKGQALPSEQGVILGSEGKKNEVTALVDTDDVHTLMIGASGVGKTAFFLYPNLEYACATGMSFLCTDTKGDLFRNYGAVARDYYGYNIAVIDLRNPTRSDGNNLLHLVNKYMDEYRADENNLAAKAKAEKYAKIISKTIINSSGDSANYGQNAFFYDAAEGLLTSVILLLAEFLPPDEEHPEERRHIVSVFKLVQDLLEPARGARGRSRFQLLNGADIKAAFGNRVDITFGDQHLVSGIYCVEADGQMLRQHPFRGQTIAAAVSALFNFLNNMLIKLQINGAVSGGDEVDGNTAHKGPPNDFWKKYSKNGQVEFKEKA